ncbi:MAG: signal peptidase I [Roseibium sp.]|nr:signal peptidase I [Roseibium sp.]
MKKRIYSFGIPFLVPVALLTADIGYDAVDFQSTRMKSYNAVSGSMKPTIETGDRFLVRLGMHRSFQAYPFLLSSHSLAPLAVEQGDIVTFAVPSSPDTIYAMRVVGLPGDTIQMASGVLHINGQPVSRERIEDYVDLDSEGAPRRIARYRETLPNGVSYDTLDLFEGSLMDDTRVFEVPLGHYFVLGDNRDNAVDSREASRVGFVPAENVNGIATRTYFDRNHQLLWRNLKPVSGNAR